MLTLFRKTAGDIYFLLLIVAHLVPLLLLSFGRVRKVHSRSRSLQKYALLVTPQRSEGGCTRYFAKIAG